VEANEVREAHPCARVVQDLQSASSRKEVSDMPKFKITKVYVITADSRIAAREQFASAMKNNLQDEYLEYFGITEIASDKPSGWGGVFKNQLMGNNKQKRY
jgi:hypothetical protein